MQKLREVRYNTGFYLTYLFQLVKAGARQTAVRTEAGAPPANST